MQTKTLRTDLFLHSFQIKIMGKSFVDMFEQCKWIWFLAGIKNRTCVVQSQGPLRVSYLEGWTWCVCVCGLGSPRGWWPKRRAEARSWLAAEEPAGAAAEAADAAAAPARSPCWAWSWQDTGRVRVSHCEGFPPEPAVGDPSETKYEYSWTSRYLLLTILHVR